MSEVHDMKLVYFVSPDHKHNYFELVERWFSPDYVLQNGVDPEYQTAIYITAHPGIYNQAREYALSETASSPLDWIGEIELSTGFSYLESLAANLWNSSNEFNLMRAMESLDDMNMSVMMCAIYMRMGAFRYY